MSGEETQARGVDGARRARNWLHSTTRVEVHWLNPEPLAVKKLTFEWANGQSFSFDLAGVLRGGDLEGQEFLAEVKNYKDASDQGGLYKKFLAQCYAAYLARPERCDNFLWITWAPFNAGSWSTLQDVGQVRDAVLAASEKCLDTEDKVEAENLIDDNVCKAVACKVRIIVLSEWQEQNLTLTTEHLAVIRSHRTRTEAR